MDPILQQLQAAWQAKHEEASAIIANPGATGPQLVKAEKFFDERDQLTEQINDRKAQLERVTTLKARYTDGRNWAGEPVRTLPFSGAQTSAIMAGKAVGQVNADHVNEFKLSGFEQAGVSSFQLDSQRKHWEMIQEAGAGTVGQKRWEIMSSFDYKRDFALFLRQGTKMIDLCTKTLQEGLDDQGGVFAPAELIARIIGRLPAPTMLRGLVTTLTTGRDVLIMPRKQYSADDQYTTAFRVTWTGEIPFDGTGQVAEVNQANLLGNIDIQVHTAMLNAPVTRNLIEDAAFPIQAWLESELAQVIDLTYEDMILNGSTNANTVLGSQFGQPIGILFGASASNGESQSVYPECVLSGTAGAIDYNQLIDLQTALAPQYEVETTRWIMNKKSTYRALNKLLDSNNRPLFTTGMEDFGIVRGRGRVLLGDEITLSQFMPNIGSGNFPLIYGDVKGYYLAQRVGFSIQVLDQTRAKANQIELVGRVRFGGRPVEPWRFKVGKSNNS
jgi:HK97 family phage major capsid protein